MVKLTNAKTQDLSQKIDVDDLREVFVTTN